MSETSNRTVIVTGGSKGIGAALSTRLAADGFNVVVNYASDAGSADNIVARIGQAGGKAIAARGDISVREEMARLFDIAEETFGGVDALVNNAGIMKLASIEDATDDVFEQMMGVNVGGVFRGMREAARRLRDGGRIVNFSSSVVGMNLPGYGLYAASKAAVEAMTRVLAKELGKRGITVNAVAPGPVATDLFLNGKSAELIASIASSNPFGRLGEPEDIAGLVAFLCGPDSGWINGQVIRANGGTI